MTDQSLNVITKWNRKIHMYLGLYMLLFLWVFSISDLFMNHPNWFKHQPQRSPQEQPVRMPDATSNTEKAQALMQQLNLTGEIIFRGQQRPGQFTFIAMRPNHRVFVNVNLQTNVAKLNVVKTQQLTATLEILHTFSGVRPIWREAEPQRDWLPTQIWSLSMDALCVGLIFIVASSLYMAFQIKQNRAWCLISFTFGTLLCSFFIWGLS